MQSNKTLSRILFWFGWCSSCTSVQCNAEKQCNRDCSSCYLQGRIIYDNVLARQKCRLQCVQIKWCINAQLLSAWQCSIHRMQQQGEEHWVNAALQEYWADQMIQCSPTLHQMIRCSPMYHHCYILQLPCSSATTAWNCKSNDHWTDQCRMHLDLAIMQFRAHLLIWF